jgi:hypothetical protein
MGRRRDGTPLIARGVLWLLALGLAATLLSGCGGHKKPTPAELSLERGDLVVISHTLQQLEGPLQSSMQDSRAAWPYVEDGLSRPRYRAARGPARRAAEAAAAIPEPAVLSETGTAELTGPISPVGGLFRTFIGLVPRSWKLIAADISELEAGPAAARQFARETVDLYIESVYDGYFSLAQIGKKLLVAYKELGGPEAFSQTLPEAQVKTLAEVYSEPTFRLEPHPGVKLGS